MIYVYAGWRVNMQDGADGISFYDIWHDFISLLANQKQQWSWRWVSSSFFRRAHSNFMSFQYFGMKCNLDELQMLHDKVSIKGAVGTINCHHSSIRYHPYLSLQWASYQIRKIANCACAGNVPPRRRFKMKPLVSDPGMHHGTCVTHVPWCMSGSLTCGDGKTFPEFLAHAHPQFCISGKRPMALVSNL